VFKIFGKAGWLARIDALFVDREFFMRANGQVKFLKIPAKLQRRVAYAFAAAVLVWLVFTLAMMVNQASVLRDRLALSAKAEAISDSEERVAAYRESIGDVTKELDQRQDVLDQMVKDHFGTKPADMPTDAAAAEKVDAALAKTTKEVSTALPEAAALVQIEVRQLAFAEQLTRAVDARTRRAETAIRKFGLNPAALTRNTENAQGGPFIPFFGQRDSNRRDTRLHPSLARLNSALERMETLEQTLIAIPSAMPTSFAVMSSGYGYRRDPFTGAGAMHAGLDFKGPLGTPIMAAAEGTVSFAGRQSGYGNCIEITHSNGLMTRYAHLSRISVQLGAEVARGTVIGAMGSTGRSTGSHLHFEVRLNGAAINPRPFLEANSDVLKIQAIARQRASEPGPRG
jgi:murein DD-endopeptidase MepM/ murein hydrolase activator NlpD